MRAGIVRPRCESVQLMSLIATEYRPVGGCFGVSAFDSVFFAGLAVGVSAYTACESENAAATARPAKAIARRLRPVRRLPTIPDWATMAILLLVIKVRCPMLK